MKVTQEKAPFRPVTLVLETPEELATLRHLTNRGWGTPEGTEYLRYQQGGVPLSFEELEAIKIRLFHQLECMFKELKE